MMLLSKPMLGTQLDHSDSLNNPVLDLLMNEGHGDRVNDLSGWGNHGTLHEFEFPATRTSGWNPGTDGVALNFDGTDDIVDCGNNEILNMGTSDFTIDVVINPSDANAAKEILNKSDGVCGFDLTHYQYKALLFLHGTDNYRYSGANALTNGQLTRITYVKQGTTIFDCYINGVKSNGAASGDTFLADIGDTTNNLYLGQNSIYTYAKCSIARARILPRAMSAFEIMQTQIDPYGVYLR